jgi:hypothetical protein
MNDLRDPSVTNFSRGISINEFDTVTQVIPYIAHLPQQCHNSKFVIFRERLLKVLKCYNFL